MEIFASNQKYLKFYRIFREIFGKNLESFRNKHLGGGSFFRGGRIEVHQGACKGVAA